MAQYHINPETGNPNICRAQVGKCPFGAEAPHFPSKDEARAGYEAEQGASSPRSRRKSKREVIHDAKTLKTIRAHDTKLAELVNEHYRRRMDYSAALRSITSTLRINTRYGMPSEEELLTQLAAREDTPRGKALAARLRSTDAAVQEVAAQINKLDEEYTGWSRFYEVAGGHIHSSMGCSTCNHSPLRPTQFSWLPKISGASDGEAVKAQGANLCTVCFPDAPTEWTNMRELEKQEKKNANCPGSGTWDYPEETARLGFYAGNFGICKHCGEAVSVSTTNKMRAHKAAAQ